MVPVKQNQGIKTKTKLNIDLQLANTAIPYGPAHTRSTESDTIHVGVTTKLNIPFCGFTLEIKITKH